MVSVREIYKQRKTASGDHLWVWECKKKAMEKHFEKIEWSDAILVLNYDKNGVKHYIGANTLIEMGLALYLKKQIYLLHDVPDLPYKEEILGMFPVVVDGDLKNIEQTYVVDERQSVNV